MIPKFFVSGNFITDDIDNIVKTGYVSYETNSFYNIILSSKMEVVSASIISLPIKDELYSSYQVNSMYNINEFSFQTASIYIELDKLEQEVV